MSGRPVVGIACRADVRDQYLGEEDLDRLRRTADVRFAEFDATGDPWGSPDPDPAAEQRMMRFASELDVLVVCHGAPRVTAAVLAASPRLRVVGDIEGDRFAGRIDVRAANEAGVLVVDTTHASSWPVAEWALALMLLGLRKQGHFRAIIAGDEMPMGRYRQDPPGRELTGKTVGLLGFGHIAWRLREFLVPFKNPVVAYDPYAARELADAQRIDFAPLETVMTSDVVVCLVPATPTTRGMIGRDELALLKQDALFVNVSRGAVVDVDALVDRAGRNDAWFGLDAHDPEPIRVDSPLRAMPNVFLSPHIAGVTAEAQPRFFALMVDELTRHFAGLEPRAQITDRVLAGRGAVPPLEVA